MKALCCICKAEVDTSIEEQDRNILGFGGRLYAYCHECEPLMRPFVAKLWHTIMRMQRQVGIDPLMLHNLQSIWEHLPDSGFAPLEVEWHDMAACERLVRQGEDDEQELVCRTLCPMCRWHEQAGNYDGVGVPLDCKTEYVSYPDGKRRQCQCRSHAHGYKHLPTEGIKQ